MSCPPVSCGAYAFNIQHLHAFAFGCAVHAVGEGTEDEPFLAASSRLHASNTVALPSLTAGLYQMSFPCNSTATSACQPLPDKVLFRHSDNQGASEGASTVQVLRPTIQVLHVLRQHPKSQRSFITAPLVKSSVQRSLAVALFVLQVTAMACAQ